METPDLTLGPEWALLELICLGLTTPHEQESFDELIRSGDIHWGELLEQALLHKMLPMLAFYTTSDQSEKVVPRSIRSHMHRVLDLNRHKATILRVEAARIIRALNGQGIRTVGTKGITLESTLYEGKGSRYMNDIDFMIVPEYRDIVTEIMLQLGYQSGYYDRQDRKLRPHNRKEIITLRLNPDHIPMFSKLTDDPVIPFVNVDFANSLTWTESPFDIPVETALDEISHQPIPGISGIKIPCFSPIFQLIYVVLHLFREAWFERWLDTGQDVNLSKFADVVRLWRASPKSFECKELVQTLEKYEIVDAILWVFEHLDRTLHTEIVAELGLEDRVTESWLSAAHAPGGGLRQWRGTMRERLHSKNRKTLFVDDS